MNALEICSVSRWTSVCNSLGLESDLKTYDALIGAHSEKHRAYHTLDHIAACFRHLDDVSHLAENASEIEMALWFHDAIYDPFSSTNEEDSAEWAADWLQDQGCERTTIARIADYILDTKSHDAPATPDGQLLLDIDLSILGAPADVFDTYELNIRREYKRVPGFIFRKKRKAILQGFLDREQIFSTQYFQDKLEQQGRINLIRAVSQL